MALTRSEIKTNVAAYTGKSDKDTLIETKCDQAIREAVFKHTFYDSITSSDVVGVADATSIAVPSGAIDVVAVGVIDTDNDYARGLDLKPVWWFNENVGVPEEQLTGWPKFGLKKGGYINFERPIDKAYTFRVYYSYAPTFASDSTECPIEVLDLFVEHYVTAYVFLAIEDTKNYSFWMQLAKGADEKEWLGGQFAVAVEADTRSSALRHDVLDIKNRKPDRPSFFTDDGTQWF